MTRKATISVHCDETPDGDRLLFAVVADDSDDLPADYDERLQAWAEEEYDHLGVGDTVNEAGTMTYDPRHEVVDIEAIADPDVFSIYDDGGSDGESQFRTVNIEVYCDAGGEAAEKDVFAVASEHRPDLPKPFNGSLQEWAEEEYDHLEVGDAVEEAGTLVYEPDGEIVRIETADE